MKIKHNSLVEYVILGVLGSLVVLTLAVPPLLRDRRCAPVLSLSVLLRDTDNSWTAARQGMELAADELGAELRFLTLTTSNSGEEQEELFLRELEGGADALIVVPSDLEGLYAALLQSPKLCPVVTLECAMAGGAGGVSPDNPEVGRQLAQALLEDWEGGEVLLLDNSAACPETAQRLAGAQETLSQAGVPFRPVSALPQDGLSIQWVITFESGATRQAAEYKESEELAFALYGVGTSTAITVSLERGTIAAAAAWSDYAAGYLAVRQAVEAAQGNSRSLESLAFSIVRGEDIYAPENQKLLFPVTS